MMWAVIRVLLGGVAAAWVDRVRCVACDGRLAAALAIVLCVGVACGDDVLNLV